MLTGSQPKLVIGKANRIGEMGFATEAIRQIIEFGFKNLDIVRIFTGIYDHNISSQKVLEKNGFQKEAVFKKAVFKNGKFCDEVRYGIIKSI